MSRGGARCVCRGWLREPGSRHRRKERRRHRRRVRLRGQVGLGRCLGLGRRLRHRRRVGLGGLVKA